MAENSKISWTDATWNPVVGCSKVSPGCQNCYAEKMAYRLAKMDIPQYFHVMMGGGKGWNGKTELVESALSKPLHWRKARKIFVCSMGDLFHESVPFEWIDKVFAVMALCPQHTFQVLTKRADRMKEYISDPKTRIRIPGVCSAKTRMPVDLGKFWAAAGWPIKNVWLGVTAENQEMADKRIPVLLQTPAVKRFVSVEPMLGAVDLDKYLPPQDCASCDTPMVCKHMEVKPCQKLLDWVIVGAESGAGRRKCKCIWPIDLVAQCQQANVPVFVKQLHAIGEGLKIIKEPAGWPRQFPTTD